MTASAGRPGHRGGGAVIGESAEFGLSEATQGLTKLDLREQELRDMEVAKKLQEEELKVMMESVEGVSSRFLRIFDFTFIRFSLVG